MARIRYYLDENVPRAVWKALLARGIDALRAQDAGLRTADDPAQLTMAASLGRVLYTNDADFLRLHARGAQHAGIVYAAQKDITIRRAIDGLEFVCFALSAEEMVNEVEFLS